MSVRAKAIHSLFWSFAERFGQQTVQLFFSVVLARLLAPDDFGLLSILMLVVALSELVVDCGVGQALVQKKELSGSDHNTVFWFSLLSGFITAAGIFLAAPRIADFYDSPILAPLTQMVSFQVLINSTTVVQRALLQRDLLFHLRAKITLAAVIISGVTAVWMARAGWGVWSLVWQVVLYILLMTGGIWMYHPFRPKAEFSGASFRWLYGFSLRLFFAALIDAVFGSLLPVIIGKMYSPAALGFFSRAQGLVKVTSNSLTGVLGQVSFPLMSRSSHEPEQAVKIFRKLLFISIVLIAPAMTGMTASGAQLVQMLLGSKWLPCVPYLLPVCLIGLMFPVQYLNQNALVALGRTDLFLRLEIIKKAAVSLALVLTFRHGVLAMCWGQAGAALVALVANSVHVGRMTGYGIFLQIRDMSGVMILCAVMGWTVYGLSGLPFPVSICFALQVLCGGVIYLLLLYVLSVLTPKTLAGRLVADGLCMVKRRLRLLTAGWSHSVSV